MVAGGGVTAAVVGGCVGGIGVVEGGGVVVGVVEEGEAAGACPLAMWRKQRQAKMLSQESEAILCSSDLIGMLGPCKRIFICSIESFKSRKSW